MAIVFGLGRCVVLCYVSVIMVSRSVILQRRKEDEEEWVCECLCVCEGCNHEYGDAGEGNI